MTRIELPQRRIVLRWSAGSGALAALGLGALALAPLRTGHLVSQPNPATDYADAQARFTRLAAAEGPEVNPLCHSRLLSHGRQTEAAVVLIHGVTNCPKQMEVLGGRLHARGYNVLIPRMPRNGLTDRLTRQLKYLTAAELAAFGDTAVDIASGLGRRVMVLGLSAGGVVAAWLAQFRAGLGRAVIVAGSFGILQLKPYQQTLARNLMCRLPSWDRTDGKALWASKPPYTYLRNSSRGLGEITRLGLATTRAATGTPAACPSITLVTNADDRVVANSFDVELARRWQAHGSGVVSYEFVAGLHLPHDVIDPLQPAAHTDIVYPRLLSFVERP